MATTTNYSWTTPDDTALVKDGAAAIRSLGTSVDTTTKNLNPSTTLGDIEYRSSTANTNTRLGIGSSGQALTVVAGVPSWAASATSTLTTTGDILYASAANTLQRLGIGTTGQNLTVAGGVPSWATASSGGMTLISTTTLTGASVLISSIPADYVHLQLIIKDYLPATDDDQIAMRLNDDSNNRYYSNNLGSNTVGQTFSTSYATPFNVGNDNAVAASLVVVNIFDYKNTDTWKYWNATGVVVNATTTTSLNIISRQGAYNQTGAISSIRLLGLAGNFTSGSVLLYGVK